MYVMKIVLLNLGTMRVKETVYRSYGLDLMIRPFLFGTNFKVNFKFNVDFNFNLVYCIKCKAN